MNGKASIKIDNECLLVSGEINFQSAVSLWNDSLPLLANCQQLNFDFSRVTYTNSSALALLIEWVKYAKSKSLAINFQHVPQQLMSISAVAGVDQFLIR